MQRTLWVVLNELGEFMGLRPNANDDYPGTRVFPDLSF